MKAPTTNPNTNVENTPNVIVSTPSPAQTVLALFCGSEGEVGCPAPPTLRIDQEVDWVVIVVAAKPVEIVAIV